MLVAETLIFEKSSTTALSISAFTLYPIIFVDTVAPTPAVPPIPNEPAMSKKSASAFADTVLSFADTIPPEIFDSTVEEITFVETSPPTPTAPPPAPATVTVLNSSSALERTFKISVFTFEFSTFALIVLFTTSVLTVNPTPTAPAPAIPPPETNNVVFPFASSLTSFPA